VAAPRSATVPHAEPALIDFRRPSARPALEDLFRRTTALCLDVLYQHAMDRPVVPSTHEDTRARFFGPSGAPADAPADPMDSGRILQELRQRIAPGCFYPHHPSAFAYFSPPPLPISVAGELVAQWLHQGVDMWTLGPVATLVEEETLAWLRTLVGYGPEGGGVLTSGGTMANLMALAIARDAHLGRLRRGDLPRGAALDGVSVYVSDQTHFSIRRALGVLGFPAEVLRVIPSDRQFRLPLGPLAAAIARDRAGGVIPFAVIATAGTTNTGSIDPLREIADLARREDMWLHVDAAYGGAARLSSRFRERLAGLEEADSVTVDPHKWFFQALDCGALLVRDRTRLAQTFHEDPEYYPPGDTDHGPPQGVVDSIEGSRRLRSLKLWMTWKHLGTQGLGSLVERGMDLTSHFVERCRARPELELAPEEPDLSVVCVRYRPPGLQGSALDALQLRIQRALEASGKAWVSTTTLRSGIWLRAAFLNYLSEESDVDAFVGMLTKMGPSLVSTDG
jgi:glutamate/tyrosine decarboxylase-like PLP-dependent enzyme